MLTEDVSFRVVTTVEGMGLFSKELPALLGKADIGLRGMKLLPNNGDVATCIVTATFERGDMTVEQKTASFRRSVGDLWYIASIIITAPTTQ